MRTVAIFLLMLGAGIGSSCAVGILKTTVFMPTGENVSYSGCDGRIFLKRTIRLATGVWLDIATSDKVSNSIKAPSKIHFTIRINKGYKVSLPNVVVNYREIGSQVRWEIALSRVSSVHCEGNDCSNVEAELDSSLELVGRNEGGAPIDRFFRNSYSGKEYRFFSVVPNSIENDFKVRIGPFIVNENEVPALDTAFVKQKRNIVFSTCTV